MKTQQTQEAGPAQSAATPSQQVAFVLPVSYAAWLAGDLGRAIQAELRSHLGAKGERASRLPRALLIEGLCADELPRVLAIAADLVASVEKAYPVFSHEMGPVLTGTVQVVPKEA